MESKKVKKLGDVIFGAIDDNDFLNMLYDHMLYNYAILKLDIGNVRKKRDVDVTAALRFADLLSKSTHPTKADDHKMWAQSIIALLLEPFTMSAPSPSKYWGEKIFPSRKLWQPLRNIWMKNTMTVCGHIPTSSLTRRKT